MRLALTVVSPTARQWADVIIDADPATPVGDVAARLERLASDGFADAGVLTGAGGPAGRGSARVLQFPGSGSHGLPSGPSPHAGRSMPLFVDFQRVPPGIAIADSPIRDGAMISLGSPEGCLRPEPAGLVEVRVAGGPGAGAVHRLSLGEADIGSAHTAAVPVADPAVPGHALRVSVDIRGGCRVTPFPGTTATLDREPLAGPADWRPGQQIAIGGTLLALAAYEPPDAALHPSEDGAGISFNRPPRLLPPARNTRFRLPKPPGKQERHPIPILMAIVPMAVGGAAYFLTKQPYTLVMCAASPVMVLGNYFSARKHGRKSHAERAAEYSEHKKRIEQEARQALEAERIQRRDDCPDPAAVLSIASGPRRRLWERRRSDPDYLLLRTGTADLPSAVELIDPEQDEHRQKVVWQVPDAPVAVPLARRGVLGVAGPGDSPRAIGRWLVAQAAALHSPNDLRIWVLTDGSGQSCWEWTRWLPHCRPGAGDGAGEAAAGQDDSAVSLVGNTAESVATRITELLALISARQSARQASRAGGDGANAALEPGPDVIVVFDGSRNLRSLPGALQILREGPDVGVRAICLDADERLLPAESQSVVVIEPDGTARVQQMNAATIWGIRPDFVSPSWCALLARSIAPVRDVSDSGSAVTLPDSSRLLDILRLEPPTAEAVARGWHGSGMSTVMPIGESYDGPFAVDLRRDGPHALIAGTTGAGKSELLQTIIASLAVANRPDAMTFVLIDYKGGSAFSDCARLPHTVGMVSDLDGHLTERALASLSAELRRREEILLHAGAKDIEDYNDTRLINPGLAALPRLVLIIDEFASLVAELPDFVTGLVGIAQRGRSLGVHLILATQRPAGVVSADIRANTNLRIALRVTDPGESSDVIDVPDAARISKSTPGRCYVRSGASGPVGVQTSRIGGRRPDAGGAGTLAPPRVIPVPWPALGRPLPESVRASGAGAGPIQTDLSALVDAIGEASGRLGLPRQPSPWLPPLPPVLTLEELPPAPGTGASPDPAPSPDGRVAPVPFGLVDVPARQGREPLCLDLAEGGHVVVAGAARTGRSTVLRTLAASIAARESAADVHLYAIDCGAGALLPLTVLPHCGAVVTRDQTDRLERLVGKLRGEVARRQQILAAGGFGGLAEQRAGTADPARRLPWIVVLLDWWEGYSAAYEKYDYGRLIDSFLQLLREGATVGVRAVVTTDRQALIGQTGTVFERRMLLRLNDPGDAMFAGIPERSLPSAQPPGRIMIEGDPNPVEVQVALLDADPSGPAQIAALRRIAEVSAARHGDVPAAQRPLRVDALPPRITRSEALRLVPSFNPPSPLWALAGAGGDELGPMGLDLLSEGPGLTIAGPPRTGRSATLATMALSLLDAGTPVLVIAPRRSPLRSLDGWPGVLGVLTGEAAPDDVTDMVSDLIDTRSAFAVVVDDAELLNGGPLSAPLEKILASGRDGEHGVIIAGSTGDLARAYSGFIKETLKSRCGVLVAVDAPTDGDIFGIRLPRNAGDTGAQGRGLLIRPGTATPVQLALPEELDGAI